MKLLNPGNPKIKKARAAHAEWRPVFVEGVCFWLEANTMAAMRADFEDMNHPAFYGAVPAPVFPRPEEFSRCRALVLNLTHACNLRCRYCFVDPDASTMSLDTALAAVEKFQPDTLSFFGGEPLLCWDTIRAVVGYAAQYFPKMRFSITTNGTLLTSEIAAMLGEFRDRFSVILSLDGSKHRHDYFRPDAAGEGSFLRALNALKLLSENGITPTLRGTFDATGLDLAAELEFLNQLCDRGHAANVSLEPASLTEGCSKSATRITPDRLRELEPEYLRAADWFCARAEAGKRARFHHLVTALTRLINRTPYATECGAGNGYLTISPTGEIHACHREGSKVGELTSGLRGHATRFSCARAEWLDNRLETHAECPTCAFRYVCGGGCRRDHLCTTGDTRKPDPLVCALTELRVKSALRVLDKIGMEKAAAACGIKIPEFSERNSAPAVNK